MSDLNAPDFDHSLPGSTRTFVLGDIHGRFRALRQVLDRSGFDPDTDLLIILGDIVDFGPETKECVDLLISVPNKVVLLGNHDFWFLYWATTGKVKPEWRFQGGYQTMRSYGFNWEGIPDAHLSFFNETLYYYRNAHNQLYVHGGFNPHLPIENQTPHDLIWNRSLVDYALDFEIPEYSHIFVGLTRTQRFRKDVPLIFHNLTMCDTGAGRDGYLSIVNADTLEFWQSEQLSFPGIMG
ncbi:MAG: metallophosphoesterase [Methanoregula sp.]|jgi:serine/threonine protein phosphatase 1|nr:metallophosphoesterase [Methanoregula sp.]